MEIVSSKLNILGSEWDLNIVPYDLDENFKKNELSGYCQSRGKKIVVCDMATHPDWKSEPFEFSNACTREGIRHEIIHAFLYESGLDADSFNEDRGWARNEEMIDWFAIQGPKIFKVWQGCHAI